MRKNYLFISLFILAILSTSFNSVYAQQYCTTFDPSSFWGFDCSDGDGVESLSITGASNTNLNFASTACNADAYWNLTTTSITFEQGGTYAGSAMSGYEDNVMCIWIDFNNDFFFDSTEKVVLDTAINELTPTSIALVIPPNASIGSHRMRVMGGYDLFSQSLTGCNDDGTGDNVLWYGRVQDFTAVIVAGTPLPVVMGELKGSYKDRLAKLTWNTQSEINNKGFEVQQSQNGRDFVKIGFVASKAANGNSSTKIDYTFTAPMDRTSQFRLVQTDFDGIKALSNVVNLNAESSGEFVYTVAPNPTKGLLKINTSNAAFNGKVALEIYDLLGKKVYSNMQDVQQMVDVSTLSQGSYILKIFNNDNISTIKFLKQ